MIGRAVISAQALEVAIVPIYQTVLLVLDPERHVKTKGMVNERDLKSPTENILKDLERRNSIAPEFATRLRAFINDRHMLIHRWIATWRPSARLEAKTDMGGWIQ